MNTSIGVRLTTWWMGLPARVRRIMGPAVAWALIYVAMVGVGMLLPIPASDWHHHWLPRQNLYDYPPWVHWLLAVLPDVPFLSGLTLTALLFVLWKRRAHRAHVVAAFTAMPLYWTLWLGQIDAVPMLGLALLPWAIPLVLLKPQVAVWHLWAWWRAQPNRRKWRIALGTAAFLGLTLLVWGPWPLAWRPPATSTGSSNVSLWHIGWPLGVLAMAGALLERDPDRAMALGSVGVPYLQGASYLVLLPALTRLHGPWLWAVWLSTWTATVVLAFGESVRFLAALFPLSLWVALWWQARQPQAGARDAGLGAD